MSSSDTIGRSDDNVQVWQTLVEDFQAQDYQAVINHAFATWGLSGPTKKTKHLQVLSIEDKNLQEHVLQLVGSAFVQVQDYEAIHKYQEGLALQDADLQGQQASIWNNFVLYAYYKQQDYAQVLSLIEKQEPPSRFCQLLRAQALYHSGQAASSHVQEVYQELLDQCPPENVETRVELMTNVLATQISYASLPWVQRETAIPMEDGLQADEDYKDVQFNTWLLETIQGQPPSGSLQLDDDEDGDNALAKTWALHWQGHKVQARDYSLPSATKTKQSIAKYNQALALGLPKLPSPPPTGVQWTPLQHVLDAYNRVVVALDAKEASASVQYLIKQIKESYGHSPPLRLWWMTQADILQIHVQMARGKATESPKLDALKQRQEELQRQLEACTDDQDKYILEHAIANIQLHLQHWSKSKNGGSTKILEDLPASIHEQPAVVTAKLMMDQQDSRESLLPSKEKPTENPLLLAQVLFAQGKFERAVALYEAAEGSLEDAHLARYIQALVVTGNSTKAVELMSKVSLPDDDIPDLLNAEEALQLEQQDLPRGSGSSGTPKLVGLEDTTVATAASGKKQRSKESILKKRAKKREEYLEKLEEKGLYNPDRPSKPAADRWVPKHMKKHGKRRQQQQQHRGHQGAGGALTEKQAQQLDVAARKAGTIESTGPSTATLKAVGGGGRKGGRRR